MMKIRISAIIPVIFSAIATALLIVLAVAGTKPGTASKYYMISLNTSRVGAGTIQFNTADGNLGSGTGVDGGLLGGLLSGLDGLIDNATGQINSELANLESEIITNVTNAIGIKDEYNIYMQNICEGNLANETNPESVKIVKCPKFNEVSDGLNNISSRIPSYVVVGNTNISVPLLQSLGTGLSSIENMADSAVKANLAFLLIGLICSGIVTLLSFVSIILPRVHIISIVCVLLATLAPLMIITTALIVTILSYFIVNMVNGVGSALTMTAKSGSGTRAIAWVAWASSVVSAVYWSLVWFVEVRRTVLVRRRRDVEQIGKYKVTLAQARRNMKVDDSTEKS
ncbi:uncharacterized protein BCR38DRAFT_522248 [Pseudomassariella vexata]|uniref:Actin cortical patch SUR7/pH-response regulator pali n=1 Tax=Pseudomassariella vexata TaxID=1141098 RepID=A0A1Y2E6T1_9PEZI|nr:uncharacterized protein BCR38DRAFT_522248 [Pseudomassariella vexata]ORY67283.1 hypothetical protein BCR38DRAFT_522248 [Pseudomassariella vexata]